MFGLGAGEILLIVFAALIFLGPKKIPELAKGLGKAIREFQKAKDELMNEVQSGASDVQSGQERPRVVEKERDRDKDKDKVETSHTPDSPSLPTGVEAAPDGVVEETAHEKTTDDHSSHKKTDNIS